MQDDVMLMLGIAKTLVQTAYDEACDKDRLYLVWCILDHLDIGEIDRARAVIADCDIGLLTENGKAMRTRLLG